MPKTTIYFVIVNMFVMKLLIKIKWDTYKYAQRKKELESDFFK